MSTHTTSMWATGLLAAVAGAGALVLSRYRRDLCTARARLEAGRRVIETAFGPMEYGESGAGQPVLVSSFLAGQIVPAR